MEFSCGDFSGPGRDQDGARYAKSFDHTERTELLSFFNLYGFVVVRSIFSPQECNLTRSAMWSSIESKNAGVHRDDVKTWDLITTTGKYGLSQREPSFDKQLVDNRQNKKLLHVLHTLIENNMDSFESDLNVMVSHDRFTLYRSTVPDNPHFRTGDRNLHLDLNPWWWVSSSEDVVSGLDSLQYADKQDFIRENNMIVKKMGRHVQCVLNFNDNMEQDGGTIIVPQFHKYLEEYCSANHYLFKSVPWHHITSNENNPIATQLLNRSIRIPMREGSVLIWDQTVAHGSAPNFSSNCRYAQFLKAFPRNNAFCISTSRLKRRARALKLELSLSGALDVVSALGWRAFGLDSLEDFQLIKGTEEEYV